ncbi:MAG: hypothetical protein WBL63_14080 [Candidatus Acidiferrum sp.]
MRDRPEITKENCEWFLNELEELPADELAGTSPEELLARMPEAARKHSVGCGNCEEALRDFAETRRALEEMKPGLPEAGPWFTSRVMGAIRAEEEQIEEKKEGVWISVRRLAPRVVAYAAVLLVLGGSWAIELRRADQARGPEVRPVESLFEGAPSAPVNDEIVASTYGGKQP